MSRQFVDGNFRSFRVTAALPQYTRVMIQSDGRVAAAGGTDKAHGITTRETFAADEEVAVRLRTASGTYVGRAGEAIALGGDAYAGPTGVFDGSGTQVEAIALSAATAAGDQFEFMFVD